MAVSSDSKDEFSKKETAERFEAALRGALKTPPVPRKSMTPKRKVKQPKASA